MLDCNRGANGGANAPVFGKRPPAIERRNSLKTQRPALACAGRAGLRIESSTAELRWRTGLQLSDGLRHAVLHRLGPVAHLAEVARGPLVHSAARMATASKSFRT